MATGTGVVNSVEERALNLLGDGIPPEQVAHALNVTPGRISQLLAQDEFAAQVVLRKYNNLSAQTDRDKRVDTLEDTILEKLRASVDCLFQPMQLARVYQIINAAKRRGSQSLNPGTLGGATVVQISMPTIIKQKFVTNINNQVTDAGDQALVTIQPKTLLESLKNRSISPESHDRTGRSTDSRDSTEAIAA